METEGLPSVVVLMDAGYAEAIKPPRAVIVRFPFGRPFGREHDAANQRVILEDCLSVLETAAERTILATSYRWRRENWQAILDERARKRAE